MIFVYRPGKKTAGKSKKISRKKSPSKPRTPNFFPKKLIFALIFLFFFFSGAFYLFLNHQIDKLSTKKQKLLLTKTSLSAKISRLKTDPKAYEEIARRHYGLVKDGERLIIFE